MKNIYYVFRILCSLEGFLWFWLECGVDRQKTAKIALRQLRGAVKKNFPDHDPFKFRYIILEGSLSMQNDRNSWLQSCGRSARVCNPACLNMIIERLVNGGLLPVEKAFIYVWRTQHSNLSPGNFNLEVQCHIQIIIFPYKIITGQFLIMFYWWVFIVFLIMIVELV